MTDHNELVRRLLAAAKPERVFAGVSSRGAVYRTDKPKHHAILREAATAISAAESRAQAAEARCEKLAKSLDLSNRTLQFVARWAWHKDYLSIPEQFSSIKFHPVIKGLAEGDTAVSKALADHHIADAGKKGAP